MDATAARARLKRMVQADAEPFLSSSEIDDLLLYAIVPDSAGLVSSDDEDWTPTYSVVYLNASAAEGWMTKAAKLGTGENFTSDGATFDPQIRRQFCIDMAAEYRKRVRGSSRTAGRTASGSNYDPLTDTTLLVN